MIYFYSKFDVFGYIKLCRKNQHFILKPFPQLVSCCLVIWQVCLLLVKAPCWLMGCHTPPAELSLFCGAETFPTGRVACRITGEQWQESSNVLVYFFYFQGLTFRIWKVNATKLFTGLPATWFVQGDACNSHGTYSTEISTGTTVKVRGMEQASFEWTQRELKKKRNCFN